MSETIYDQLIERLGTEGRLTSTRQAELDAIRSIADIGKNDSFWLHFLPVYLTSARLEDLKEIKASETNSKTAIDVDRLAQKIVARIEPDQINATIDPAVISRQVMKAIKPDFDELIQQIGANAKTSSGQGADLERAVSQSLLHRHLVIAVLGGLLLSFISGMVSASRTESNLQIIIDRQAQQIKDLQGQLGKH
jgi:hypothetical protein